jgi:hypothetical protein
LRDGRRRQTFSVVNPTTPTRWRRAAAFPAFPTALVCSLLAGVALSPASAQTVGGPTAGPTLDLAPPSEPQFTLEVQRPPRGNVVVYSRLTRAGAARAAERWPGEPQYYFLAYHGWQEMGAGRRERPPPPREEVERAVRLALEGLDYRPVTGDSPRLDYAIACYLGTLNRTTVSGGQLAIVPPGDARMVDQSGGMVPGGVLDPALDLANATLAAGSARIESGASSFTLNEADLRILVGGDAIERMSDRDPAKRRLLTEANEDRYFILLLAYDGADVLEGRKPPRLLWSAQMSVASLGTNLVDAVPALVAAGQPWFGRGMERPAIIRFGRGRPEVILGTPEFRGYVEDSEEAEVRSSTSPAPRR